MNTSPRSDLNAMWDRIDFKSKKDIVKEGNEWGGQYLEQIINELVELKKKYRKEHNPLMYHQLNTSLTRAHEVQNELQEKIKNK